MKYNIEGSGETVLNQIPKLGIKVNQQSTVMLYTEEKMKNTTTTVPNLLNMTVGQAAAAISQGRAQYQYCRCRRNARHNERHFVQTVGRGRVGCGNRHNGYGGI